LIKHYSERALTFGISPCNDYLIDFENIETWKTLRKIASHYRKNEVVVIFIGYSQNYCKTQNFPETNLLDVLPTWFHDSVQIKIVLASSFSVYDSQFIGELNEFSPLNPTTAYARMKRELELKINNLALENKIYSALILRIPCLIGKNAKHNFLTKIFKAARENKIALLSYPEEDFNAVTNFCEFSSAVDNWLKHVEKPKSITLNLSGNGFVKLGQFFKVHGIVYRLPNKNWPIPPRKISLDGFAQINYIPERTEKILVDYFNGNY
jgi:hypothetical protein